MELIQYNSNAEKPYYPLAHFAERVHNQGKASGVQIAIAFTSVSHTSQFRNITVCYEIMTTSTISSTSSLSQRFRRAIVNNDLASAKRIAEKAFAKNGAETDPFTIQNQTVSRNDSGTVLASLRLGVGEYDSTWFQTASTIESAALSASQYQSALQCRRREKNREAGRAKSSLAIAVENGANIDLVQWLLDMGHERGVFSTVSGSGKIRHDYSLIRHGIGCARLHDSVFGCSKQSL